MLKMETKVCSKCNINKPYSDYYLNKKCVGGVNSYCKKCHLEKKRLWRKNNPEQYKKQVKDYWGKVKLFQTEKKKVWIENNREKYNSYWTNRKKNDPKFKLIINMRTRLCGYLKKHDITKKNKTFDIVGCSPEFLKEYLEKQFTGGMSWELFGEHIHIDHIIPLSSAKTEDEIYKLCHYTNLQPLWAEDNLKKSNKILVEQE
jgi:hypothetical protein